MVYASGSGSVSGCHLSLCVFPKSLQRIGIALPQSLTLLCLLLESPYRHLRLRQVCPLSVHGLHGFFQLLLQLDYRI